jgi:hypothetical protein
VSTVGTVATARVWNRYAVLTAILLCTTLASLRSAPSYSTASTTASLSTNVRSVCVCCLSHRAELVDRLYLYRGRLLPQQAAGWVVLYPVPISTHIIMANIMIMGDSWACGEWGGSDTPEGYRVLHAGTQQYLREAGHRVVSVAQGGSCNRVQVDRVRPGRVRGIDHSIWFLSDPCRDIPETDIAPTLVEYRAQRDHLLRQQFDRVRHLPLWLVGGVCPVPAWVADEYPGFTTLVPDLRRWLLQGEEPCETLCRAWRYPDCDPALLTHWEQDERTLTLHRRRAEHEHTTEEHRWFWPDGRHPNRHAHQRLTHELILPLVARLAG